jgi:competence protein ComEC
VRLVVWCIAYLIGDACALAGLVGARAWSVLTGVAGAAAVVAIVARRRWPGGAAGGAVWLVAWWFLGAALGARALRGAPVDVTLAAAMARDEPAAIEAVVVRGPEELPVVDGAAGEELPGARMVVALQEIAGVPAAGTISLTVIHGWPDFAPGERIACDAHLRELRGTRNPGLPDPTLTLRAAGIDALAGVARAADIHRVGEAGGHGLRRAAFLAHRAMRAAIDRVVRGPAAAFLRTAVLGERRGVGSDVEDGFRAAGATHVLSVSGLHLAAVAAALFLALRFVALRVPRLPLYVDPRAVAAAGAIPAIGFFTLLTGEAIATERSALMLSIGMAAHLVGRRASPGPTIAAAALALLIWRPLQLLDASLQLSLASVAGIALLAGLGRGRERGKARSRRAAAVRWLTRFGAATAAATAATGPLVAHHFGEIAPLSPAGNLALVPLVELAVVPAGLLGGAVGALAPALGRVPLAAAGIAARAALAVAAWFGRHAPLWVCRTPNMFETAALTAAGVFGLSALARRGQARRRLLAVATLGALLGAGSLVARDLLRRHARDLVVTFLDVGQGDAAVVEAPGGAVMLIDGGGTRDGAFDTGARIVEPFLRARGISHLDVVALSHPHPDHLNGLFRIVGRFSVGAFWSSGDDGRNPQYRRLIDAVAARGVAAPAVAPRWLGPARIEPLGPFLDDRIAAPPGLSVNDASLVLRVAFGERAVLFPGDLEADGEGELAGRRAAEQAVAADVLKVPHHGSRTSSSTELLDAVHPSLAVMSLGWRNQFHFPAPEVVARYAARGARVLRTDRDGAITVRVSPEGATAASCERGCPGPQPR